MAPKLDARARGAPRRHEEAKQEPSLLSCCWRTNAIEVRAIQHDVRITRINPTHRAIDHHRSHSTRGRARGVARVRAHAIRPRRLSALSPRSDKEEPADADDGIDDNVHDSLERRRQQQRDSKKARGNRRRGRAAAAADRVGRARLRVDRKASAAPWRPPTLSTRPVGP